MAVLRAARETVLDWLLAGDVSIQYQTRRDLLDEERPDLRARIAREGWGRRFLEARNSDGSWGRGFYQPKWTSSHYTLLDLKALQIDPGHPVPQESIRRIADTHKGADGGINPSRTVEQSDVCVNGMFLSYACYFGLEEKELRSVVDYVLGERMADGGFNCERIRPGAHHSSLHSSISVAEGILEYERCGYRYRLDELREAARSIRAFVLRHRLFRSDRTGEIIHRDMLRLSFPCRWKYDILRGLEHFRDAEAPWDEAMSDALEVLRGKRRRDGSWPLGARHPGRTHFDMERAGQPSRWNTLRALRVLRFYGSDA